MPLAARTTDQTAHGNPLAPGPGSTTVMIGNLPAWRALPAALGSAVASLSQAANQFMTTPMMTPADATAQLGNLAAGMTRVGAEAAAEGDPSTASAANAQIATLNSTNVALTSTWATASAAPGGQPAANQAYTEGIKAALAAAVSAVFSSLAGMADMHVCPIPTPVPPHGPGFVTSASQTVRADNLPLSRMGDQVMEAVGGADPIVLGCPTVNVG